MVIFGISTLKHFGRPLVTSNNGTASTMTITKHDNKHKLSWRTTIASLEKEKNEREEDDDDVKTERGRLVVVQVITVLFFDAGAAVGCCLILLLFD